MILKTRPSLWGLNYVSSCEANSAKRHLYTCSIHLYEQRSNCCETHDNLSLCCFSKSRVRTEPFVISARRAPPPPRERRYQKERTADVKNPLHWLSSVGVRNGFGRHADWALYLEKYGTINEGPLPASRGFAGDALFHSSWKCLRRCLPQIARWEKRGDEAQTNRKQVQQVRSPLSSSDSPPAQTSAGLIPWVIIFTARFACSFAPRAI